MPEGTELCAVCGSAAEHKCSACRNVFYCSREHQKCHWKTHMKKCRSFKVAENDVLGRHYVAIRNIAPGEVVLREDKALVAGPPHDTAPVCLGCLTVLNNDNAHPCEKCGWPLCLACESHGPECEFTRKYKEEKVSITDFVYPHPTYQCVTPIRALCLRENDPQKYQIFMNLESHVKSDKKRWNAEDLISTATFIKRFFKVEVPEEEVIKLIGIIQVNGHEVPLAELPHVAVYNLTSFIEHSCRANCMKSFTNDAGIIIRAAIPISKGEHITICYTDPLWGTANRRHYLEETKYFHCICDRCQDPTEFGTMFNAVRCTAKHCKGFMLPKSFIIHDDEKLDHYCNKCPNVVGSENIEKIMERIGIDLSHMKRDDIKSCKMFIDYYGKLLHENHYYITDVKLALAQIMGQQDGGLPATSDEMLSEKILLCKQLTELLKTLVPAENRVRGLVLFEMHAAIAEFGRRQGPGPLRGALLESKRVLIEAHELLSYEPEALPEGRIAVQARKNLQSMEAVLRIMHQNAGMSPM